MDSDEHRDILLSTIGTTLCFMAEENSDIEIGKDLILSIIKDDPILFRKIIENETTVLDKQKIIDMLFENKKFRETFVKSVKSENEEMLLEITKREMKIKIENELNNIIFDNITYQHNDLLFAQLMLFPVHYSDSRPLLSKALFDAKNCTRYIKEKSLPPDALEKIMFGLLCKSSDWQYEHEWRILQIGKNETMKLPKPRKLFLGVNIEESSKLRLLQIAAKKKIPVFQMYMSADKYRFDYYQISDNKN